MLEKIAENKKRRIQAKIRRCETVIHNIKIDEMESTAETDEVIMYSTTKKPGISIISMQMAEDLRADVDELARMREAMGQEKSAKAFFAVEDEVECCIIQTGWRMKMMEKAIIEKAEVIMIEEKK